MVFIGRATHLNHQHPASYISSCSCGFVCKNFMSYLSAWNFFHILLSNTRTPIITLTELSIVAKIFSLNIRVKVPKIMQHDDITNRSSLLVLMSPVKFILIYSNYLISLSLKVFWCHLFTPRRLRSDWQTIRLIRSCQLSYRHWTPEPSEAFLEKETRRRHEGSETAGRDYSAAITYLCSWWWLQDRPGPGRSIKAPSSAL